MFEKVLVPTDFSKYAERLIDCVAEIPGVSEVVLLNVIPRDPLARVWSPGDEMKDAAQKLEEPKKTLEEMGLRVKTVVLPAEEGEEYRVIERVAENEGVSLIVMGARGRSIITGLLLGSVSTNVLRYGSHDVLIMRYKTMDDGSLEKFCPLLFSKLLLPTDFSKPGMAAIDLVKKHKLTDNAHLINIVARGESPKQVEARVSDAKNKLQVISDDLAKAGVKSTIEVVSASAGEPRTYGTGGMAAVKTPFVDVGGAAEKILSKAEEMDVSLIALSSAGKGYLDALTIGSVVFDIARMGKRPILVVRSGR